MQHKMLLVMVLLMVTLFIGSELTPVFAQNLFEQPVRVKCDLCNGSGKIEHTLTYQILADDEQTDFEVWKVPAGLYFREMITVKNTDDYEGDFSIKITITIGGNPSYETISLHLASQESETEYFPTSTGWYWAGVLTHSHNLQVIASQISITCPKCNGTGFVTSYVTDWTRVSVTAAIAICAVLLPSALFVMRRKRVSATQTEGPTNQIERKSSAS